ncbi:hypothetical protein AXG93_2818s1200 [Marchantia polymorpha subsp. ruderalis]|nr:hypothetical protein AXG93_2818s1200 [Marchantia polymorpha subsp. ruderalis]
MKIPRRLEGKVAVVTASSAGIGFGIAERLGLEGASVVISSRKQKNVDDAAAQLRMKGIDVIGVVCHVNNADQRKNLIKTTMEKYGRLDFLVSNAAANPSVDSITTMAEPVLDKLWATNVKAGILLVQDAVPYMKKGSSIVFISSIAGFNPIAAGLQMYAVTKTALLGLTKALAAELGPEIRVNCVCPGFVPTHFADFLIRDEELKKEHEGATIMNRLGTTSDMAAAVAYLVSDDASYVTGENLAVAGGMPSRL